jgi:hypothetical protein
VDVVVPLGVVAPAVVGEVVPEPEPEEVGFFPTQLVSATKDVYCGL